MNEYLLKGQGAMSKTMPEYSEEYFSVRERDTWLNKLYQKIRREKTKPKYENLPAEFKQWIKEARRRIHSIAAGRNASYVARCIMEVGFAKLLYGLNELELDYSHAFVLFAPDGTFSMNMERLQRGFTYGAVIHFGTEDYLAAHNAMPNGCGFSIYELGSSKFDDDEIIKIARDHQDRLEDDKKLNVGNHFAGIYRGIDPTTKEDSGRRFVVIHCSGHVGKEKLYHVGWLENYGGFNLVNTPLGPVTILQDEARKEYLKWFEWSNGQNESNRESYLKTIFGEGTYKTLASVTHQGLFRNGSEIRLGVQESQKILPTAYNAQEGLDMVKGLVNIKEHILETLEPFKSLRNRPYLDDLLDINVVPHGGGYEFLDDVKFVKIFLNNEGIEKLKLKMVNPISKTRYIIEFQDFKATRKLLRYRRRAEIQKQVIRYQLAETIYHLYPLFQIYPPIERQGVYMVAKNQKQDLNLEIKPAS